MRLSEQILQFVGRVEVVLAGADGALREAEDALSRGEALKARGAAHALLQRIPRSPIGLALLADACELGGLQAELLQTLEELSQRLGSRADVWLRLASARAHAGAEPGEVQEALLRGLAVAEPGSSTRRALLLELADRDREDGELARAELWLARLLHEHEPAVQLRWGELRLAQGRLAEAEALLAKLPLEPSDGRLALALGMTRAQRGEPDAWPLLLRAYLLDQPHADVQLRRALWRVPLDEAMRERLHTACAGKGEANDERFRAAFYHAEGDAEAAREALLRASQAGDVEARSALLEWSLHAQDAQRLALAVAQAPDGPSRRDALRVLFARGPSQPQDPAHLLLQLDALAELETADGQAWAEPLREACWAQLLPADQPAPWELLLARYDQLARQLGELTALSELAELVRERARPLRMAVVGEFNAGKSTFLNALLGAEIAPTGILPTTATLHHVRYAPDPLARIQLRDAHGGAAGERLVALPELRAVLAQLDADAVERVEIHSPLPSLTQLEILDTPGFNAPDPRHTRSARAAFLEADVIVWLFDAAQPFKDTERAILQEAQTLGLPTLALVNKTDRLQPQERAQVLHLLRRSLESLQLPLLAEPRLLSARLALRGRLGDHEALQSSGFSEVQALLDQQVLARREVLKERALRRRLRGPVARLERALLEQAEQTERARQTVRTERQHAAHLGARIEDQLDELSLWLVTELAPAQAHWQSEVQTALVGRDRLHAAREPSHRRYHLDSALRRLVPALRDALKGSVLGPLPLPATTIEGAARTALRASVPLSNEPLPAAARAVWLSLAEALAEQAQAQAPDDPLLHKLPELRTLRHQLGGDRGTLSA